MWENLIELEWFYFALLGQSLSLKDIVQYIPEKLSNVTYINTLFPYSKIKHITYPITY